MIHGEEQSKGTKFISRGILRGIIAAIAGLMLFPAAARSASLSFLADYSIVIRDNATLSGDVTGKADIGGDLNASNSVNFASRLRGSVSSSDITVSVGGNVSAGNPIQIEAGSFLVGGTTNGRIINYNGGGSLVSGSGDSLDHFNLLSEASRAMTELPEGGAVTIPVSQPSAYVFIAEPDAKGLAVFNIDAFSLFGNPLVQQIELIANGATDILINVSGTDVSFNYGNLVGLFTDPSYASKIVWNFFEAETIDLGSKSFTGLVLSPSATLTSSGKITGVVVANELESSGRIEGGYNGIFASDTESPLAVPEPGGPLLASEAFLLLWRRRRKAELSTKM